MIIAQTLKQKTVMIKTNLSVYSNKNLKHLLKPDADADRAKADEAIVEKM